MKILFINTGPWGTGSFTVIKGLTKEFQKLGHEIKIFFPDSNFESIDRDEYYNNRELYQIWEFPITNPLANLPTFPLMITDPHPRNPDAITFKELTDQQLTVYEQELQKQLSLLIASFKPDIIDCHHIWYASWVLHEMGLDYIVTAHHSDQLGFRYDPRVHAKAIAAAQGAKKIVAISELVKNEVMRLYHVDQSKIVVTENAYDKDIFRRMQVEREPFLKSLGIKINPEAPIISFAGKLSRTKGIDTLLEANKLLNPSMNIQIIVMGAGTIETICRKMRPNTYSLANLHFIGHQTPENVAKIHNISKLSLMPSRSEGFGISGLEAMGCGLPLIVTRCGVPEHYSVGKVIDKGSAPQLAQAIIDILKLPASEYQKLSQQALSAAEKFSWQNVAQKHLEMYSELVTGIEPNEKTTKEY